MNVIYIHHRTSHHARHSGYGKILDYMPFPHISGHHSCMPYKIRKTISRLFSNNGGIYNSSSVAKELELTKHILSQKNGLAHFLNGERDIRFTTLIKKISHWQLLATFHKPPSIFHKTITNTNYLKRLDGAIAVGINQLDFISNELKIKNIRYIPHGIDCDYFFPSESEEWDQNTCLFVGHHLRDFQLLEKCIQIVKQQINNFTLKIVIPNQFINYLPNWNFIEVHSGISDSALRDLYRRSAALILPLKDSTACNAILESLACGLPIVTNAVGGIKGYMDNSCGYISETSSYSDMAEALIDLMENRDKNNATRLNCRAKSLEYDWARVATKIQDFYTDIESK